jgi:hypothetical protein
LSSFSGAAATVWVNPVVTSNGGRNRFHVVAMLDSLLDT